MTNTHERPSTDADPDVVVAWMLSVCACAQRGCPECRELVAEWRKTMLGLLRRAGVPPIADRRPH